MPNYANWGNEKLLPIAIAGDQEAIDELTARGNTVMPDGSLQKDYITRTRNASGGDDVTIRTVNNGRLIRKTINGVEIKPQLDGVN